jgi:hypothetical protein
MTIYIVWNHDCTTQVIEKELSLVTTLGLTPYKDGDRWCYLLGTNLQEGVSGFGETPYLAALDFDRNYRGVNNVSTQATSTENVGSSPTTPTDL